MDTQPNCTFKGTVKGKAVECSLKLNHPGPHMHVRERDELGRAISVVRIG